MSVSLLIFQGIRVLRSDPHACAARAWQQVGPHYSTVAHGYCTSLLQTRPPRSESDGPDRLNRRDYRVKYERHPSAHLKELIDVKAHAGL